jgi:hypothetical protein
MSKHGSYAYGRSIRYAKSGNFGLRWEDLDWKRDVIQVRQALYWRFGKHVRLFIFTTPKSEASIRDIDLSSTFKRELGQLRDQLTTVTVSPSGDVTTIAAERADLLHR